MLMIIVMILTLPLNLFLYLYYNCNLLFYLIISVITTFILHLLLYQDPLLAVEQVRVVGLDVLVFGDVFMDVHTLFATMLRMAPAQVSQNPQSNSQSNSSIL